jgi:2,3-diketo-5-methylthio-1-phosphopentane phosphatase
MPSASRIRSKPSAATAAVLFCDFDGTVTQLDVTDLILTRLAHPSWQKVEQEWVCGSIGSRECLERQMALVNASAEELDRLIASVPIDPHFSTFYRQTLDWDLPVYFLSDGFDYVIRRVLKLAGVNGTLRNGTNVFASALRVDGRRLVVKFPYADPPCEHGCATCKAGVIRRLNRGRRPVIFVGDGLSDRFAVAEADIIFAKRQLLAYCQAEGVACYAYETFADVRAGLEKLIPRGRKGPRRVRTAAQ